MRVYFRNKRENSDFHEAIVRTDKAYAPANLASEKECTMAGRGVEDRMERWTKKTLHNRYISKISAADAVKENSLLRLKVGYLFLETEGFIMAIQYQVINAKITGNIS